MALNLTHKSLSIFKKVLAADYAAFGFPSVVVSDCAPTEWQRSIEAAAERLVAIDDQVCLSMAVNTSSKTLICPPQVEA
jgi:hypothetical protein